MTATTSMTDATMARARAGSGPLVSVIIPAYNAEAFLADAIDSVLSQTYRNLEVIVVDDCSTDGTADVAARYGGAVTCVRHPVNMGPAAARNTGIERSRGELIGFNDADDLWEPDLLAKQVPLLLSAEDIVLVYGATEFHHLESGDKHLYAYMPIRDAVDVIERQTITTSIALLKRSALDRAGLFDDALPIGEDWDFFVRMACVGRLVGSKEVIGTVRRFNNDNRSNMSDQYFTTSNRLLDVYARRFADHPRCRDVVRRKREHVRLCYYIGTAEKARHAWADGRYLTSIWHRCKALIRHPSMLVQLVHRLSNTTPTDRLTRA